MTNNLNLPINCPICNDRAILIKNINGINIYDCLICNHRFAKVDDRLSHLEANFDDKYFLGGGVGGYQNYFAETDLLYKRGKKYAQLLHKMGIPNGKLLDVGAAAGFILKGFIDEGWEGVGLEPNKTMVEYANNKLKLEVYQSALEEFEYKEQFDCISMIQVIVSMYDLKKAVSNVSSLLKDEGILLVEAWDRKSITARLFGWKWHEYCPPTVVHWFTKKYLIKYLKSSGFSLVKSGRILKRINSGHAKTLLFEKFHNKFLKKLINIIPDRLNLIYPSEDLFYLVLKKTDKL